MSTAVTVLALAAACGGGGDGEEAAAPPAFANIAELTAELAAAGIPCEPVEGFPDPSETAAYCGHPGGFLDYIVKINLDPADQTEDVAEALEVEEAVLVGANWFATEESGDVELTELQSVLGGRIVDDPADLVTSGA